MKRFPLAAALAAVAACAPPPPVQQMEPPAAGQPAPSSPAPSGPITPRRFDEQTSAHFRYNSGLAEPGRQVVRDAAAWSALWARITAPHGPPPPLPAVDFAREMVLVAAMGSRSTGGYSVRVEGVDGGEREWVATVAEQRPGPRCGTIQAVTAPVDIVVVPRSDRPVRWAVREVVNDCP